MDYDVTQESERVLHRLRADPQLNKFIDQALGLPRVFRGTGQIRLIVLGQDPTVKNVASRGNIHQVLNLDKRGSLKVYLTQICEEFDLKL